MHDNINYAHTPMPKSREFAFFSGGSVAKIVYRSKYDWEELQNNKVLCQSVNVWFDQVINQALILYFLWKRI